MPRGRSASYHALMDAFRVLAKNTPPEPGVPCDWSEVDALCRERSVLLDCNDLDRVDLLLKYSRS